MSQSDDDQRELERLSMRIKELGEKSTQILLFLSFHGFRDDIGKRQVYGASITCIERCSFLVEDRSYSDASRRASRQRIWLGFSTVV